MENTARMEYETYSDRQLVTRIKVTEDAKESTKLQEVLYQRYAKFVHKHWHQLQRQLNSSSAVQEVKDDFYAESYITFTNALAAVNINKIENDKWKFLGYYGFYLSNQRKAIAQRVIKKSAKEKSLELSVEDSVSGGSLYRSDLAEAGKVPSAEEMFLQQDDRQRFWNALKICRAEVWGDMENKIFDLRLKKTPIKTICVELHISPWKYNKILSLMKQNLDKQLQL